MTTITAQELIRLFEETSRNFEKTERMFQESERIWREQRQEAERVQREQQVTNDLVRREQIEAHERAQREQQAAYERTQREQQEAYERTQREQREQREQWQQAALRRELEDKRMQEKLDKLSKNIGAIGNRLGDFVQDMVEPAVVNLFRSRGLDVHEVVVGYQVNRDNEAFEVDLLVINDGDAIAVECKSRPNRDDVDEHLQRLAKVRRHAALVRDKRLLGAMAGMKFDEDTARYAASCGLYVLRQNGDIVQLANTPDFEPRYW